MSTSCVFTGSDEFRRALRNSGLNQGTLAGIVSEYINNPNLKEQGHPDFPSDEYIKNYFIRSHWATPEEAKVWQARYTQPRIVDTYEQALQLKREAEQYFNPEDVNIYKLQDNSWAMRVSRPIVRMNKQSSKERLLKLQSRVDSLVNNGSLYSGSIKKNAAANKQLGDLEDNFERQYGIKVTSRWDTKAKKFIVRYKENPSDLPGNSQSAVGYQAPEKHAELSETATKLANLVEAASRVRRQETINSMDKTGTFTLDKKNFTKGQKVSAVEVLSLIANKSTDAHYQALAKALLPIISKLNIEYLFETQDSGLFKRNQAGTTDNESGNIYINLDTKKSNVAIEHTLLHELIHGATIQSLRKYTDATEEVQNIMDYVQDYIAKDSTKFYNSYYISETGEKKVIPMDIYGLMTPREFIAEFFSNKEFQDMLKEIPARNNPKESALTHLLHFFTKLFDRIIGRSLYDEILPTMSWIISDFDDNVSLYNDLGGRESLDEDSTESEKIEIDQLEESFKEAEKYAQALVDAINTKIPEVKLTTEEEPLASPSSLEEENKESKKVNQIKKIISDKDSMGEQIAKELGIPVSSAEDLKNDSSKEAAIDGTVFFTYTAPEEGNSNITDKGLDLLKEKTQFLTITVNDTSNKEEAIDKITNFIKEKKISNLNISGSDINTIYSTQRKYPNLKEDFESILRGALKQMEQIEKPASTVVSVDTFMLTQEENKEGKYTGIFSIQNIEGTFSEMQKIDYINRMIVSGELPIGSFIKAAGLDKASKDTLNTMEKKGIYKTRDGNYTVGLREDEINKIDEFKNLLDKPIFRATELRHLAKMAIFKLSENITLLQSDPKAGKVLLGDDYEDKDFTTMSRIEIIQKIGLGTLLEKTVKEPIFNTSKNTEPADNDDTIAEKMDVIYNNFDAFIKLGYDALIGMEEISFVDRAVEVSQENRGINANNGLVDTTTEQEAQEIYGSAVEHWQVGFRQVSAFNSLSQMIKRALDKMYKLNPDGSQIVNDYGLAETIDSSEAVSDILHWTQYAESLDEKDINGNYLSTSMIGMLQQHMQTAPWLRQLVGNYHLGGDITAPEVLGELIKPDNYTFQSQFFSNFKKYFQKYTITYKDNSGKTLLKAINENTYIDTALREIEDRAVSKSMGNLNIWDTDKQSLNFGNIARLNTIWETLNTANILGDKEIKMIEEAYKILNIDTPEFDEFKALFNPEELKTFLKSLRFLVRTLEEKSTAANASTFNPVDSKVARSDYKNLIGILSPAMGGNIEAVSYEAGKLYYGYVTPSYLNKLIGKLKGNTADYEKFMFQEYKQYEGMFFNSTSPDEEGRVISGPQGWMNYWLEKLNAPGEQGSKYRKLLEHVASLSYNKIGYVDKTPAQYMASMISMYLYDDNAASAYYRMPIMSNKPTEEYIKFERMSVGYRETISKYLAEHTFYQELNRIRAVKDRNTILNKEQLIKNFDKNGLTFQFLDYLNDYIDAYKNNYEDSPKYELGRLISKLIDGQEFSPTVQYEDAEQTVGEASYFKKALEQAIQNSMDVKFEEFLKDAEKEGFITRDAQNNITSVFEIADKVGGDPITSRRKLEEFFWNDAFATINLLQLTVTDIAYYKDTEDLQKRLAQLHAPGMRGNINARDLKGNKVTDGKERTMYVADSIVESDILDNLKLVHQNLMKEDRFKNNPAAKAAMEDKLDKIREAFKHVNFADAQGYSSPTSYRKKMAIFGKWDQRQEDAYQRILSGNFSEADLSIAWQPLKPFVYAQIEKNGHTDYMPKLKVGVQNKNSEYLLVIADALMRSQGIDSKLSAIYDIMEESQGLTKDEHGHWSGTPNARGIDTIQFESAVKAGLTGIFDINNLNKAEIKDLFNSKMYNQDGSYNIDYVHELPFEDYCIQQEIPAHFKGSQSQGSQNRILSITDMPNTASDGSINYVTINLEDSKGNRVPETISVEEAKNRYYQAITDNIHDSLKEIINRFNLNSGNTKLRNIALSRILQQEIIKDARYGTDLLWACSVNKNGEFNIPLSDPIQSGRIQQLLNSIIKNTINKQEVAGGPVVQVSNYGTGKDLNIRFQDKDGNILLSKKEFNDALQGKPVNTKFIPIGKHTTYDSYTNAHQYSLAYVECYVPIYDDNLIKDFEKPDGTIDIEAMERENPRLLEMVGYRIPTEDKYSMITMKIMGFIPRESGEAVMLPKEITALSGSDFDIDKLYVMRYNFHRVEYKDRRTFAKEIAEQTGLDSHYIQSLVSGKQEEGKSIGESTDRRIMQAWENFRGTRASYRSWQRGKFANDNQIVALQWGLLTAPQAQSQVLASGNFDEPKRVGYMIAAMDNTHRSYEALRKMDIDQLKKASYVKKSLIYANTQMQFHKQNMVAAKLIGVFAQANVSHGFVGLNNNATLDIPSSSKFVMEGRTVKDLFPIDREFSDNGVTRVSSSLAEFLAASADAVKDPILNLMNINMATVNVAVALSRMGFSTETVGWFLTHPAIVDLVKTYNMENTHGRTSIEQVIADKTKNLKETYHTASKDDFNFTKEFFIENHDRIDENSSEEEKQEQANNDYNVLLLYSKLNEISKVFRLITHMTRYNSISSAVGPFAANTMVMKIQDTEFEANKYITDTVRAAADNPILKAFRYSSYALEKELLGKNIIQASPIFEQVFETLYGRMGYMNDSLANKFSNFFMSFYVNLDNPVFNLGYENRSYMIDKFPVEFLKMKEKYSSNLFLKSIKMSQDRFGNNILELKTRGMQAGQIQDIKNGWADLYIQDPQLALKLVEYNFFRGSFGFNPQTFMSLVPNQVKVGIQNYISNLNKVRELTPEETENLLTQFMLNTGTINLGKHNISDLRISYADEEKNVFIAQKEDFTDTVGSVRGVSLLTMEDGTKQYVTVEPNPADKLNSVIFSKVNKLGGNNQGFEIDPTVRVPKSVWIDAVEEENTTIEDTREEVSSMEGPKHTYYSTMLKMLFNKAGELTTLLDGTSDNQIKLFNERLQEHWDNPIAFPNIPEAVVDKIKEIISNTDIANLTMQKAEETINELNLCQ